MSWQLDEDLNYKFRSSVIVVLGKSSLWIWLHYNSKGKIWSDVFFFCHLQLVFKINGSNLLSLATSRCWSFASSALSFLAVLLHLFHHTELSDHRYLPTSQVPLTLFTPCPLCLVFEYICLLHLKTLRTFFFYCVFKCFHISWWVLK